MPCVAGIAVHLDEGSKGSPVQEGLLVAGCKRNQYACVFGGLGGMSEVTKRGFRSPVEVSSGVIWAVEHGCVRWKYARRPKEDKAGGASMWLGATGIGGIGVHGLSGASVDSSIGRRTSSWPRTSCSCTVRPASGCTYGRARYWCWAT